MKNPPTLLDDLSAIRQIMERSVKFLSLTGLSGVLAGLYTLAGTAVAYFLFYHPGTPAGNGAIPSDPVTIRNCLVTNALVVLILALITAYLMSLRKARKMNVRLWSPSSKNFLFNMGIPLVTGACSF
jgi:predicted lysophospholipase L1 biosynthesis ABC-type transport system permease subunit